MIDIIDKLTAAYGKEWTQLNNIESVLIHFKNKGVELTDIQIDYINAIRTLTRNIMPWVSYHVFENIVDALNGTPVIPDVETAPTVEEMSAAVSLINSIRSFDFHDDVAKYIAAKSLEEGILWLPEPLSFVNPYLQFPKGHQLYVLQSQAIKSFSKITDIDNYEYEDDDLGVQLYKMARVKLAGSCS